MKRIYFIIGVITAAIFLNSCNEWLDVNPRSEVKENVLFSNEDGYKKALIGAYILMAQDKLYGRNTSMYIPELLARHWTIPPTESGGGRGAEMNRLSSFDYTHPAVEQLIKTVWLQYYKVIVQLNDILENLSKTDVSFEQNNDLLIKGEILGLRAFLHLEVLRFFGPVPSESSLTEVAIPYVKEKTKEPAKLVSIPYSEVIKNIEEDLNAAEEILKSVDPILEYTNIQLNYPYVTNRPVELYDSFHWYRQGRFNYFACLGTKARLYQWTGNKNKAAEYAKMVIEALNKDNNRTPKFRLTTESDFNNASLNDLTMYGEHLFGVHNPELQRIVEPLFKASEALLTQSQTTLASVNCFDNTVSPSDIRYKPNTMSLRYWDLRTYSNSRQLNHFRKFTGNEQIATNNRVPLLRLAEMYLILIENLPIEEAKTYFSTFRIARSMDISTENTFDESSRIQRVEREYRKDFYGEGQMFFFYKRHNYRNYVWPGAFALPAVQDGNAYMIPKPSEQLVFEK